MGEKIQDVCVYTKRNKVALAGVFQVFQVSLGMESCKAVWSFFRGTVEGSINLETQDTVP